jgi:chromodomain-helicase-DNA-binding protein 1
MELLIKWNNQSYRHATWEPLSGLKGLKGYRKVENFYKRILQDQEYRSHPSTSPDEIEQLEIELDLHRELLKDYMKCDRVISSRVQEASDKNDGGVEYLCKWKRLPYSDVTWESAQDISGEFQKEIDEFLDRNQSVNLPHKSGLYLKKRSEYKPFQKQPEYLSGGELRDFQIVGVNWMAHLWHNNKNGILADEMVFLEYKY